VVLGPGEAALYDRGAGRIRIEQLKAKAAEAEVLVQAAESKHRELVRARQMVRSFRDRYPMGWFAQAEDELAQARRDGAEQAGRLEELRRTRLAKQEERKALAARRDQLERDIRGTQTTVYDLNAFVVNWVKPVAGWRQELAAVERRAREAAGEAKQWEHLGDEAEARAETLAAEAQAQGEAASRYEEELRRVAYTTGPPELAQGPLDRLRTDYETLKASYEQQVGAEQSAALAQQDESNAREQRRRLARLLSEEITDEVVRHHLSDLTNDEEVDSLRERAESLVNSLHGRVGRLSQLARAEQDAVSEAELRCAELDVSEDLVPPPPSHQSADGEAGRLEEAVRAAEAAAEQSERAAATAREQARVLRNRAEAFERLADQLGGVVADYSDLFASLPAGETDEDSEAAADGPGGLELATAGDELTVGQYVRRAAGELRQVREQWNKLDLRRSELAAEVRSVAGDGSAAVSASRPDGWTTSSPAATTSWRTAVPGWPIS
jgi:fused signal recognition particle receptor